MMGLQATGRIKLYQAIVGIVVFLNLPISYLLIRITHQPVMIFMTGLVMAFIALLFRLYFLNRNMNFPVKLYLKEVVLKIIALGILIAMIWLGVSLIHIDNKWILFLVKSGILILSVAFLSYQILFNTMEKENLKGMIMEKIKK
ncbi:MAG TPA: hypothetical protein DCP54_13450 [Chryseobacterium sp.]|nr:hypothetical protein [Chryseobacterium sp.]